MGGPGGGDRRGPVLLVDVELTEPLPDLDSGPAQDGGDYDEARVLVRLHHRPLGTVTLPLGPHGVVAGVVADAVWSEFSAAIVAHCREDGLGEPENLPEAGLPRCAGEPPCSWRRALERAGVEPPLATVVVTTCGGPSGGLLRTVDDVLAQTYPRLDVVVVDNRPETSGVRHALAPVLATDDRLRYVAEPRPGLAHARNRGAAVAQGEIVAFTDDDVRVDPDWLGFLVAGFERPTVACVTGLILPFELETPAQRLLEEFGGYAKGFTRRTWDCGDNRPSNPLYPYTVGAFGSGANAAFRASALAAIGRFDGALGAGTPARGGEDIDIYVTCVERGWAIVYEPAALVRHAHLRDMAQVRAKIRDYGVGLGAMLTKHFFRDWVTAVEMLARVPAGLVHLLSQRSPKNVAKAAGYPRRLVLAELEGLLYGPPAYLRSRVSS